LNFSQTADKLLGDKQLLTKSRDAKLWEQLTHYQCLNDNEKPKHPQWNYPELPPKLLQEALSGHAAWAVQDFEIVQRALARLYAVAWFGRGSQSVEAKRQLEQLLPTGKTNPITKWIPELARKFRQITNSIRESNKLVSADFPREVDRVKKLAELYGETTAVILDTLRKSEKSFVAERLSEVLGIPKETVRKSL
jgi:hypothetical protein